MINESDNTSSSSKESNGNKSKKKNSKNDKSKTTKSKNTTHTGKNSNKKAADSVKNNVTITEEILQNLVADGEVNSCMCVTMSPLMVHICLMLYLKLL